MRIAVLPGDGIGPEVIAATVSVLDAVTDGLEMINADIGADCFKRTGEYLPRETLDVIDEADAVLLGTIEHPVGDRTYRNPVMMLKRQMDLYANIRPIVRIADDVGICDTDMIMVRENLEGVNSLAESEDLDGTTFERRVSIKNCKRICRIARAIGEARGREKVTCLHKADVLTLSDGMFRSIFYEEMDGSRLKAEDELVERAAARMIMSPRSLDVTVAMNLYGDVLSEVGSATVGGAHMTPSGNIGDSKGLFEPMHGAEPGNAGKDIANPISSMLSAAMMLDFLDMRRESGIIWDSVTAAVRGGIRPRDIGGTVGTYEFAGKVAELCHSSLQGMK